MNWFTRLFLWIGRLFLPKDKPPGELPVETPSSRSQTPTPVYDEPDSTPTPEFYTPIGDAQPIYVVAHTTDDTMTLPDDFAINLDHMIPVESGQAVSKGWTSYSDKKPLGVTWHWTATWDLKTCTRILGGSDALRKGEASCHYGIGRTFDEGVHQYIDLDNRSWHAGAGQTKNYDGTPLKSSRYKASRNTVGIETVHIGYTRKKVPRLDDYYDVGTQNGSIITVAPWTEEQILMMIHVGKLIVERFPHIGPRDHHGHHDICPGRKTDVNGFPFARVLRGIYGDDSIPDVWSEFWEGEAGIQARQQALIDLGYNLGSYGADGDWGRMSEAALEKFQRDNGMVDDGMWDTYVCWKIHDLRNG